MEQDIRVAREEGRNAFNAQVKIKKNLLFCSIICKNKLARIGLAFYDVILVIRLHGADIINGSGINILREKFGN